MASQTAGSKSRVPPTAGSTPATTNTMTRSRKKKAAPQPPGVVPLASSKASTGLKKQGPRSSLPYMAFRVKVGIDLIFCREYKETKMFISFPVLR